MKLDQIILTAADGSQTLIDLWGDGSVEVSTRHCEGDGWRPNTLTGMQVRVLRNVQ